MQISALNPPTHFNYNGERYAIAYGLYGPSGAPVISDKNGNSQITYLLTDAGCPPNTYDFIAAVHLLLTLRNCTNCANCINCTNCTDCKSCANCHNCHKCDSSESCANCHKCDSSTDCHNCDKCYNCHNENNLFNVTNE